MHENFQDVKLVTTNYQIPRSIGQISFIIEDKEIKYRICIGRRNNEKDTYIKKRVQFSIQALEQYH